MPAQDDAWIFISAVLLGFVLESLVMILTGF